MKTILAVILVLLPLSHFQYADEPKYYTSKCSADSDPNDIVLHNTKPQALKDNDPFGAVCGNLFDDLDFEEYTMEQLNDFYGIEFDRITRLHGNWKGVHPELGVYFDDSTVAGHGIAWSRNAIYYELPDNSVLTVEAQKGKLPSSLVAGCAPIPRYSTVNGHKAAIYLDGYVNKTYPNGNAKLEAVVEFDGTLVRLTAEGFTEELFMSVLDEYTK